jgi:hypothetical protein
LSCCSKNTARNSHNLFHPPVHTRRDQRSRILPATAITSSMLSLDSFTSNDRVAVATAIRIMIRPPSTSDNTIVHNIPLKVKAVECCQIPKCPSSEHSHSTRSIGTRPPEKHPREPRRPVKTVRFDGLVTIFNVGAIASPCNADVWWTGAELKAFRHREQGALSVTTAKGKHDHVDATSSVPAYLQAIKRVHDALCGGIRTGCNNSGRSSDTSGCRHHDHHCLQFGENSAADNPMNELVKHLRQGSDRGLELIFSASWRDHGDVNHDHVKETVVSIVSVYRRVRQKASATTTLGPDDVARIVRSHAVALTNCNQQWAHTLGLADERAVVTH